MAHKLHIGKCTVEAKTTVPEEFSEHIAELARKASCSPSELIRDALYLSFTGSTYSCHVANDRRSLFQGEGRALGVNKANEDDLK